MQREMDARPGAMLLGASSLFSTTNIGARHRHSSPRQAPQRRRHPYIIPGREQLPQNELALPELIQRRAQLRSVIKSIEQGIETMLAQTGGFLGDAWTAKLRKMHVDLLKHKTLLVRVDQDIHDMLGGNLAHLNTMTSVAGPAGVMHGGGMSQQPWTQSASPTPIFGTNPGVKAPLIGRRGANPVALDEQLGMPRAPQRTFQNCVPTAGLSMVPASQGPSSILPNGMPPPQMAGTKPAIQSGVILPPTEEQLAHAVDVIQNLKRVYSAKPPTMQLHELSDNQRIEYNQLLEQLHKMTRDLDAKLPMYWIVLRSDDMIRNLVAIVSLVAYQMFCQCGSIGSYFVIIDPSALQSMYGLLQKAIEYFEQRYQMLDAAVAPQQIGRGLTGLLINRLSPPPTTPNDIPSPQPIPQIPIPDLTGLITRCNQDPVSGGTYGNIYRCIYHGPEGDVDVAIKAFRPQFFNSELMVAFRRELGIWKRLQHHNILKFMGTTRDFGPSEALVAPWIVNDTLTSFLTDNNKTLMRRDRLLLLRDVAAGLDYLHTFSFAVDGYTYSNPVVHGDLTGNNILIGKDGTAYLADFGLSGTLTKLPGMTYLAKMSRHPGAVRWAAPELLSVEETASAITTQSDIYSFGSVMLQVLTGDIPWHHFTNDFVIWLKVIEGERNPRPDDRYVTEQQWNFITRCWSKTPIDRPSAKEALQFVNSELARYD